MPTPAPAPSPVVTLPFDPSGTLASNKVTGERQVLNAVADNAFSLLIPKAAPYYQPSMKVKLYPAGSDLSEGVDYICSHYFLQASRSIGIPVYGSITFYNTALQGVIDFTYQSVGGNWTLTEDQISAILANIVANPRITTWESVTQLPSMFPVINHDYNVKDMVNMDSVVAKLTEIVTAIGQAQTNTINTHIADYNNPHGVTKAQVGLPLVPNYAAALPDDAVAGSADNLLMTPALVTIQVNQMVGTAFAAHIIDHGNPHNVNAAQVGLDKVPNLPLATLEQAQIGSDNASFMTPALTMALLSAQGVSGLSAHVADRNNPHGVTAAQVGLDKVPNFPVTTQTNAQAGASNVELMTPLMTAYAITSQALTPLNAHVNNKNNPHAVTALQVGAYTTAEVDTLIAGRQAALGFAPVQQGGGAAMGTNKVYIGWDSSGAGLRVSVDSTALGLVMFRGEAVAQSQVSGLSAALAGKLDTGAKAADSNKLNGQVASYYATASQASSLQSQINSLQSQINALKNTPAPAPAPSPTPSPAPAPAPTGGGGGGGCIGVAMFLKPGMVASSAMENEEIDSIDYNPLRIVARPIRKLKIEPQPCWFMETESGCQVVASDTTPMTLKDGTVDYFQNMLNKEVVVDDHGDIRWEKVTTLYYVGVQDVVLIDLDNQNYFAGVDANRRIGTHNLIMQK